MVFVRISETAVEKELQNIDLLLKSVSTAQDREAELQHAWFQIFGMERLVAASIAERTAIGEKDLIEDAQYRRVSLLLFDALRKIEQQMDRLPRT